MTLNELLIRRKGAIALNPYKLIKKTPGNNINMAVAIEKNVEALGYKFSKDLICVLSDYDTNELCEINKEIISILKRLSGADCTYKVMYPNFPNDVPMEEMYINALVHYLSSGAVLPAYEKDERFPLIEDVSLKEIKYLKDDYMNVIREIANNILYSKTNISKQDEKDLEWIFKQYPFLRFEDKEVFPCKEVSAFYCKMLIGMAEDAKENNPNWWYESLFDCTSKQMRTATDVLRLVTALSDGDISLASNTRFIKLKRYQRKLVMDLLANIGFITEDMFAYKERWIRIGEIIHPNEYYQKDKIKYENVFIAFDIIRNNKKPLFFKGRVNKYLQEKNLLEALNTLGERPGEFARVLDKLLRDYNGKFDNQIIVQFFEKVASKVSTPVLLQVMNHFEDLYLRGREGIRSFFPKGEKCRVYVTDNTLPAINEEVCDKVVNICKNALIEIYAKREPLNKVYIDIGLLNFNVPYSQRSSSSGTKMITRGSTILLKEDTNYIRPFVWWTNTEYGNRVDVDLSVVMLSDKFEHIDSLDYMSLKRPWGIHSGDIVDGGPFNKEGASEFIDVNIESVLKYGGRYLVFSVNSFTMQTFDKLKHLKFGWMERGKPEMGEIFEPSTVQNVLGISSNSVGCVLMILDCENREMIWADTVYGKTIMNFPNNVRNNDKNIDYLARAIAYMIKPNMYDVAWMNARARGFLVNERESADIIFSNDTTANEGQRVVTAYDLDYWMANMI